MEIVSLMALVEVDPQGNEKIVETANEYIGFARFVGLWTWEQAVSYQSLAREHGHPTARPVRFRRDDHF